MITPELLDYIKQQFITGVSERDVRNTLFENSWMKEDVDEAISYVKKITTSKSSKKKKLLVLSGTFFVIFIAFILLCIFFALSQTKVTETKNETGFAVQRSDDGQRIADLLKIQKELEDYYTKNNKYPGSLNELSDVPKNPSGGNYAYNPIGNPSTSYTLNAQIEGTADSQISIKGGFLTLKNQQGKK